jgi:D-alanyl-D-alanine carboxypeptidase/D-alanyl-D-alanine-endopeptidase (penicillin-binding protein 4)
LPRGRARVLWLTLAVVLALAVTGGAATWVGLSGPERISAPPFPVPGLRATPSPVLVPDGTTGPAPDGAALARALAPLVGDPRLGGSVAASVVDAETGTPLYDRRATVAVAPASTNKIVTAATVLAATGPDRRLATRVLAGPRPGDVVLVGGGDPTLAAGANGSYRGAARLDRLAVQVRRAAGKAGPVRRVLVDSSLFSGPVTGPGWDADIVAYGYAAPITALTVDAGRLDPRSEARAPEPDLAAGRAFARALGVPVARVARGTAPAGAAVLGTVRSPSMLRMVEEMLTASDNVLAETLVRQVALAQGQPASFAGAAAAVRTVLGRLGLDTSAARFVDASGLSRANRLTPALLTSVLTLTESPDHPELRGVLSGLPIAGYSGTLADRFAVSPARAGAGLVRAKTGTLSGISALAGVLIDADGRRLAFAVLADGVPPGGTDAAERALDRLGAALVR